jgi:hypothetical protein
VWERVPPLFGITWYMSRSNSCHPRGVFPQYRIPPLLLQNVRTFGFARIPMQRCRLRILAYNPRNQVQQKPTLGNRDRVGAVALRSSETIGFGEKFDRGSGVVPVRRSECGFGSSDERKDAQSTLIPREFRPRQSKAKCIFQKRVHCNLY